MSDNFVFNGVSNKCQNKTCLCGDGKFIDFLFRNDTTLSQNIPEIGIKKAFSLARSRELQTMKIHENLIIEI